MILHKCVLKYLQYLFIFSKSDKVHNPQVQTSRKGDRACVPLQNVRIEAETQDMSD